MNKEKLVEQMTKTLMDQGLIIEAGWIGLKIMAVADDASPIQVEEMRNSFFAGAQHLFASILHGLDPDKEPTEADMRRMDLIDAELRQFITEYEAKLKGRA